MPTYLPPNVWVDAPCDKPVPSSLPEPPAARSEPPDVSIDTVGDYIEAHGLHVVIAIPGLRDLPISSVKVEHSEETQLTYFTQQGSAIGTAAWAPLPQDDGPDAYANRRGA